MRQQLEVLCPIKRTWWFDSTHRHYFWKGHYDYIFWTTRKYLFTAYNPVKLTGVAFFDHVLIGFQIAKNDVGGACLDEVNIRYEEYL